MRRKLIHGLMLAADAEVGVAAVLVLPPAAAQEPEKDEWSGKTR